ncbi:hypothetical protein HCU66_17180 [Pseudomonas frederiksbergensis]|uniref:hypothetical protein n=1 Tax=Pseudomonas frederiksbergensis TaxID=104087 RepID=UPI00197F94D7|nr:hypothetical protein [Pseudomonas frederiksbergensis]MBN3863973.1 hypothetical protein [Pseudomonas frederiksbergensis]
MEGRGVDLTHTEPSPQFAPAPESQPPTIEIVDLPIDTHIRHIPTELPLSNYFLPPRLVARLPEPDAQSGIRPAGSMRLYVDLVDGGTVLIGNDAQNQYRARLSNELRPSGPRLEQVTGTLKWRPILSGSVMEGGTSELIITRRRLPEEEQQAVLAKRGRAADEETPQIDADEGTSAGTNRTASESRAPQVPAIDLLLDPWKTWGVAREHTSPDNITIEGIHYKLVPRGTAPNEPIVYIKNPTHMIYDYASLDRILKTDFLQQPRGVIRVPPALHWEVDPNLPFQRPLTEYVASHFPELTDASRFNVAKKQFILANGSDMATGTGLTLLRQTFNDWKTGNSTPRPELADPLLMLQTLPTSAAAGKTRTLVLPVPNTEGSMQRLDFDPQRFQPEWRYFISTQSATDLKLFMANLLTRNGYTVFEPSPLNAYPTLVFRRTGHDLLFVLSLYRIRGRKIHQPLDLDPGRSHARLTDHVGKQAMQAVQAAHAANKVVWLKGGSQIAIAYPDTVFIIRDDQPKL